MKSLAMLAAVLLLHLHCTKSEMQIQPPVTIKDSPGSPVKPVLPKPQFYCIESYQSLVARLGGNEIAISKVVLEDNTVISAEGTIDQIVYSVVDQSGPASLFTSRLSVTHRYWGYPQTYTQQTWSLGCRLAQPGGGVLANLSLPSGNATVNAGLVWSVPPFEHVGKKIQLLIH